MTPSIPPGFEGLFDAVSQPPEAHTRPPYAIDGSEVRFVGISVRGWIDANMPLSAMAGVVEVAAQAAGMTVDGVKVFPVRGDR